MTEQTSINSRRVNYTCVTPPNGNFTQHRVYRVFFTGVVYVLNNDLMQRYEMWPSDFEACFNKKG